MTTEILDVYQVRQQKLADLRQAGFNHPNQFRPTHQADSVLLKYNQETKEILANTLINVAVAGRIVLRRVMGKASFFHIQDHSGRIQIYLRQTDMPDIYEMFKQLDLGDIVGINGYLFKTNTNELSIHATALELLTKSLRPLPDKYHGLIDPELRYRKRYVDLIANEETRKLFQIRSRVIQNVRKFMDEHGFLEVETPMMHPIPGGALAKPFITHHNTFDQTMYLRIAPELYLKRLVVGGFDRVYEINRNFRNEGISTRHNPEFTMIEFYQAYADYNDLMNFSEKLLQFLAMQILQSTQLLYQDQCIDFAKPFARLSVREAIVTYLKEVTLEQLTSIESCREILTQYQLPYAVSDSLAKLYMILFEEKVEDCLIQPTFITEYPIEVSPLARRSDQHPELTDRFELFIAGREIANGFSELNDAEDQAARFLQQVAEKNAGDQEAMQFDQDYIEALEYGLPPTAGEGIGIDRLVMLFTNAASIREVILFPHLRQI